MATYCGNHVLEVVREKAPTSEHGAVLLIPTKKGSCGHLGGCATAHDDLFDVRIKYQPTEKQIAEGKAAKKKADTEKKVADAEQKKLADEATKKEADEKAKEKAEEAEAAKKDAEAEAETPAEPEAPTQ